MRTGITTTLTRRNLLATTAGAAAASLAMPSYLRAQGASITGGIKSLGGAKLEIVMGDARSTPDGGTSEVEHMQNEGVAAIVGGFASPICLAATQAAARYDLPYIVDVGVTDAIVQRGLKNTFRFAPGFGVVSATAVENLVKLNDGA